MTMQPHPCLEPDELYTSAVMTRITPGERSDMDQPVWDNRRPMAKIGREALAMILGAPDSAATMEHAKAQLDYNRARKYRRDGQ